MTSTDRCPNFPRCSGDCPVGQCEIDEHFPGCHPEHAEGDREPDRLPEPGEAQDCWHCGTPTPQGCHCVECLDGADYIPPEYAYHCPVCKRWWATMMPVITTITFGEPEAPRDGAP